MKDLIATTALIAAVALAAPAFADDGKACADANHVRIGDACVVGTAAVQTWTVFGMAEQQTAAQINALPGTIFVQGAPLMCADFPRTFLRIASPGPTPCMGDIAYAGPLVEVNAPDGERWYRYDKVHPGTGALAPQIQKVNVPAHVPAGFVAIVNF